MDGTLGRVEDVTAKPKDKKWQLYKQRYMSPVDTSVINVERAHCFEPGNYFTEI